MKIFKIPISRLFLCCLLINTAGPVLASATAGGAANSASSTSGKSLASAASLPVVPPPTNSPSLASVSQNPVTAAPTPSPKVASAVANSASNVPAAGTSAPSQSYASLAVGAQKPRATTISTSKPSGPFNSNGQVTKVIDVHHAHTDPAFKQKVEGTWQNLSGNNPQSFLNVDPGTASIYVHGDEQQVVDLENYINSLDKPITQIRIDAIILFASRNYNFDWGFNWSGIYNRAQTLAATGNPFGFAGMGGELTDIPRPTGAVGTGGGTSASYTTTNNLFVDPTNFALNLFNKVFSATTSTNAGNSFVQVPFVFGGADLNLRRLSLMLNAAESEQKVKIVSRPSVLTSNGKQAKVIIGQQLPMQQSQLNNTGGTLYKGNSINYRSVGIQLTVTPTVGGTDSSKSVSLDIDIRDIEISSGTTQSNAEGIMTNPPVLSDLTVTNTVTLKSGQTTVIGGLAQRTDNKTRNRIPLLYRLPVVGNLFKADLNSDAELEQFIFITPTIIEEDL